MWFAGLGEPAGTLAAPSAAFPSSLQAQDMPPKALHGIYGRRAEGQNLHPLLINPLWLNKSVSSAGVTPLLVPALLDARSAVTGH